MSERHRPANRRVCWRIKFLWESPASDEAASRKFKFFGTISYAGPWNKPDLSRPLEIFINSAKVTSDMQASNSEAAIFVSFALQHGATVKELLDATVKDECGKPATAVGQLLALIDAGLLVPEEMRPGGALDHGFTLYKLVDA